MKARGIPINGVGLEMHIKSATQPQNVVQNIQRLKALGLYVDVSELDVSVYSPSTQQRSTYWDQIKTCINWRCRAVTVWGGSDIQRPAGQGNLLFDTSYLPKDPGAFTGALDAMEGRFWRTLSKSYSPWDHSITFMGFSQTSYAPEYNIATYFTLYTARNATSAMKPIYLCNVTGVQDNFLSSSSTCEGQQGGGIYGYGYKAAAPGLIPIMRCTINGEHFHSRYANCEGYTMEGPTFYSP
jgi:hypothetical protein